MTATITIPFPILSRNAVDKMHWAQKARLRKQYTQAISLAMLAAGIPKADGNLYDLELVTYRRIAVKDADNLIGGAKSMVDALTEKHAHFIGDDSEKCIGRPTIRQEKAGKGEEERTMITRRELCE